MEVVNEEFRKDESLRLRTEWKPQDISRLLEISVETYFKTMDEKIYFQRDGLPIGKSISKPMAGIYMHWFEKKYVFNEESVSRKILCSGRDRWTIFSSFGGEQNMIWSCLYGP